MECSLTLQLGRKNLEECNSSDHLGCFIFWWHVELGAGETEKGGIKIFITGVFGCKHQKMISPKLHKKERIRRILLRGLFTGKGVVQVGP